jgi:hypothetical protein
VQCNICKFVMHYCKGRIKSRSGLKTRPGQNQ